MIQLGFTSLGILLILDILYIRYVRQSVMEQYKKDQDAAFEQLALMMNRYVVGMLVVIFIGWLIATRSTLNAFAATAILGMINTMLTFVIYALMGRRR